MSTSRQVQGKTTPEGHTVRFSMIDVTKQTFYRSPDLACAAIVNLKPIVPGHVLVIPTTLYHRLSEVPPDALTTLFRSVQEVAKGLEQIFDAEAVTISIQDGEAAGQTMSHLHVHILPRRQGDIVPKDRIYEHLDGWGFQDVKRQKANVKMDASEDRQARTASQMQSEASFLASFFDKEGRFDTSRLTRERKLDV